MEPLLGKKVKLKTGIYNKKIGTVIEENSKMIQIKCTFNSKPFIILMEKENLDEKIEICPED